MHNHRDLRVWQKAKELALDIYKATIAFPDVEKFGLVSQMRRSAVSIASNIAEGAGRNSKAEFRQFLSIAQGSGYELETQIIIAKDLGLFKDLKTEPILDLLIEVQKMNAGLQKTLKN